MVGILSLWLPILIATVLVFVASSIIHMFLPYHRTDFAGVPNEDRLMEAMRGLDLAPGDYAIPHSGGDPEVLKSDAFREKARQGPVAFMTVFPPGDPFGMGAQLAQWFVYLLVVSVLTAYITGRALGPGAEYLDVFRFAGTTAFIAYAAGLWQRSIWYRLKWSTTLKSSFDGLVFGLLTAGVFGWLWP